MFDTPSAFQTPEDICNRALQHCGVRRIVSLADASQQAAACQFVYDKVGRAELRRNTWVFSTRRTAISAMQANTTGTLTASADTPQSGPNTGTLFFKPAVWNAATR